MQKKKQNKKINRKSKNYPIHYLALTLGLVLLVEGMVFGSASNSNLTEATSIFDVSMAAKQTSSDVVSTLTPVIDLVDSINLFYQLATDEMMSLLDLSGSVREIPNVYLGMSSFFDQASVQMIALLDASSMVDWTPKISGISIER
ncbi:MAG: hypothetical protein A3B10_04285 [Candidatus Doudnabacteria bacterium RIFCSPLOWO2_01_FULL_44_21]|uniref:Uncharacterized protein n=1 Tax=Candidatus Doudnabacteria bacterium RIFCSPLOWO2_01_FULL_44_21 TaxID=1817841 RepID=A0A1F5PYB5_9BACT|nr:MAG: hypothetical protein A3B95_01240 [Candidatus Doudnabacteria bacterium RIFCSPHIGHO2_02_FULL_43_13b]OGE94702.1 MAG: hypothetical protein A3B10_04285 [Candidatus Doudnabacteria bacterium RIFCSPLOWO2_01_FULL_44_21]